MQNGSSWCCKHYYYQWYFLCIFLYLNKHPLIPFFWLRFPLNIRSQAARLTTNQITVLVVVPIQLVHRIAEQRSVLGLTLVLSHQLRLLLTRSGQDSTHSRLHFREARLRRNLRSRRFFRRRVTQLTGIHLAGTFVGAEVHIAVLTHLFFMLSMRAIGLISAIMLR